MSQRTLCLITPPLFETSLVTGAFTCPNPNWREDVQSITITSFRYTVTFDGFSQPAIRIPS